MERKLYLNIEYIKQVMKEQNLTEEQLAEKMEISPKRLYFYMHKWEQKRIRLDIITNFCNTLKIPFKLLITENPPKLDE